MPSDSDTSLVEALEKLETSYGKGNTKLSDITNNANTFVNAHNGNAQRRVFFLPLEFCFYSFILIHNNNSSLLMLSVNTHEDDIWCIDPRGHLTLSVSKDTYERLGIVGKKLPFKIHEDRHGGFVLFRAQKRNVKNVIYLFCSYRYGVRGSGNYGGSGEAKDDFGRLG